MVSVPIVNSNDCLIVNVDLMEHMEFFNCYDHGLLFLLSDRTLIIYAHRFYLYELFIL